MYLRSGRDMRFRMEAKTPSASGSLTCNACCRRVIHSTSGATVYVTAVEDIQGLTGTGKSLAESVCDAAALFAGNLELHLVNGWRLPGARPVTHGFSELFEPVADLFEWDVGASPRYLQVQGFFNQNNKVVAVRWSEQIGEKQQYYMWHRSGSPMKQLRLPLSCPSFSESKENSEANGR